MAKAIEQPKKTTPAQTLEWHHFDAKEETLGRMSTKIAHLLMGKHRSDWAANKVAPVYIVVTNTDKLKVTGRKLDQKMYRHHTGYPGALKERNLAEQMRRDSRQVVWNSIYGMLPKNSLRTKRLTHLKLYPGADHPHEAQIKKA